MLNVKKLICWLFGHNYMYYREFSYTSRCVKCPRCNRFWAMNDEVKALIPWDGTFSELYNWEPPKTK